MLALLLLAADPQTAVEAERAFARAAQTDGQWTAFRATSTDDAIWFRPQPAKVHETLPDKDPPIAVQWWPAESHVSCDGMVAVNTGPWVRPKAVGYFTTVWARQPDGEYKWVLDHGDALATPRRLPEKPVVRKAACSGTPPTDPLPGPEAKYRGAGASPDRTLVWSWVVLEDGGRAFETLVWDGKRYQSVIRDVVAAPPPAE
jgi:hypothetical protein